MFSEQCAREKIRIIIIITRVSSKYIYDKIRTHTHIYIYDIKYKISSAYSTANEAYDGPT